MSFRDRSPWMSLKEAAAYEKRGKRWLAKQATDGYVRYAIVGGRKEEYFKREWLDAHLESMRSR
jgi:hypothetical protein